MASHVRIAVVLLVPLLLVGPSVTASFPLAFEDDRGSQPWELQTLPGVPPGVEQAPTSTPVGEQTCQGVELSASHGGEWLARYGERWCGSHAGHDVAYSPEGSTVYVAGSGDDRGSPYLVEDRSSRDAVVVAYDALDGSQLWVNRYTATSGNDVASSIAAGPRGERVYVTGGVDGSDAMETVALAARDGTVDWRHRYDGPRKEDIGNLGAAVIPAGDGEGVYVTGLADFSRVETLAYDAETGDLLWSTGIEGEPHVDARGRALVLDSQGDRLFVAGGIDSRDRVHDLDRILLSLDPTTGQIQWSRIDESPDKTAHLDVAATGGLVLATGPVNETGGFDYGVFAHEQDTGATAWSTLWNGPSGHSDVPAALSVSSEGQQVYVTGSTKVQALPFSQPGPTGVWDVATLALSTAGGQVEWSSLYSAGTGGTASDWGADVGVHPTTGTVIVTGGTSLPDDQNYLTLAYEPSSGQVEGVDQLDSGGNNEEWANALALSPTGERFVVTGESSGTHVCRPTDGACAVGGSQIATLGYQLPGEAVAGGES